MGVRALVCAGIEVLLLATAGYYVGTLIGMKPLGALLFGGGIWGRIRVYYYWGRDISVTDGFWIIQLGSRGLLGFACSFAVLMLPALVMVARIRRIPSVADRRVVLALCLVVMTYTIDLLPNTLWSSVPIFMSGALAGAMTGIRRARRVRAPSPPEISHQNLATLLRE